MSDREALLAAIHSSPDDDLPRLIYADWLEENGESLPVEERESAASRAAFIRAQIEAARAEPYSPAARAAADRAALLLTANNREAWSATLRGRILDATFERGFIEHVTVDAAVFPAIAESLLTEEPIRSMRLVRPNPRFSGYEVLLGPCFETKSLERIASLDLQNLELLQTDCEMLAESPALARLERLSLRGNPIFPNWIRETLQSNVWPGLADLNLGEITNLGPAIARGFREADHRRFRSLNLSGVAFRSEDLKRALECPCVSKIEELRLRWDGGPDRPGPLCHLELGWVIPWEGLKVLDLEGQGLGPDGLRGMIRHEQTGELRWLNLARNHLGMSGGSLLVEESRLKLFYLDVRENGLRPRAIAALQRRFPEARIVS